MDAQPISDDLQPPWQGLHKAHQVPHQPKSRSNPRCYRKGCCCLFLGLVILILLAKFYLKTKCSYSLEDFRVSLSKDPQEPIFFCTAKGWQNKKY
jgi:hypothetical protein